MYPLPVPDSQAISMVTERPVTEWSSRAWPVEAAGKEPTLNELLQRFHAEARRSPGSRARLHRPVRASRQATPFPAREPGPTEAFVFSASARSAFWRQPEDVTLADFVFAHPRRDFARWRSQWHRPVAQYSRTVGDLVTCESRLERSFVLLADFTPAVAHITSQPCTIVYPKGAPIRFHTPDFVVLGHGLPPLVVDVKRPEQAALDRIWQRHLLVGRTLARIGVAYTVWTGVPDVVSINLGNFAGAGVALPKEVRANAAEQVRALTTTKSMTAQALATRLEQTVQLPYVLGLALLRELLWERVVSTPLNVMYTPQSVITS